MSTSIDSIVRRLFTDERTQTVVIGYITTGEPVVVDDMVPNPEYCAPGVDAIGAWSQNAPPEYGWVPSVETLRILILNMQSPRGRRDKDRDDRHNET